MVSLRNERKIQQDMGWREMAFLETVWEFLRACLMWIEDRIRDE